MRWAFEQGRSAHRINSTLSSMRVPVRYALANEQLEKDPFKHIVEATETPLERGILSQKEINALINMPIEDLRYRAAVLLAALCGMRRGEIRGLFWGDISDGVVDLTHNFVNADGLKAPSVTVNERFPCRSR
jgi:integrase